MGISSIKKLSAGSQLGLWHLTEPWQQMLPMLHLTASQLLALQEKKTDKRKQEWLACRLLLQQMSQLEPVVQYDQNRKPHLKNGRYQLSMSHSGEYAAVYIHANQPVGVDIQQIKPDISKGADYFLHPREQTWVDVNDNLLLHLIWAAKEAVFKYRGDADLDLKKHIITNSFESNQNGQIQVSILKGEPAQTVGVQFDTFDDYVLAWTL